MPAFIAAVLLFCFYQIGTSGPRTTYKKVRLANMQIVQCAVVSPAFLGSCARLSGCKDGIDRCVQTYEVLP